MQVTILGLAGLCLAFGAETCPFFVNSLNDLNPFLTGKPIFINKNFSTIKQADGSFNNHYFNAILNPWFDNNRKVASILCVTLDVTEQVLARKKVEDSEKALKSLNLFLWPPMNFVPPLSGIMTSASLIDSYRKPEDELKKDKHVQTIKKSVKNLTTFLNDFLSLDKLYEGNFLANPTEFK